MAIITDLKTYPYEVMNKDTGETETHFGVGFRLDTVSFNIAYSDFQAVQIDVSEKTGQATFSFKDVRATLSFKDSTDLQLEMSEALKLEQKAALDRV